MSRLVIGVGNPLRGDDAAGLRAAQLVKSARVEEVVDCSDLMTMWGEDDSVIVIDAMVSGAAPGTVRRYDGLTQNLPARAFASTHAFGLAEAVEMSRVLGRLPRALTVFGIEAASFEQGSGLSPDVERAAREVASMVDEGVA